MATHALTTRRALFAVPVLLPALPVLAHASPPPGKYDWPAFIKLMEWMHPFGRAAALSAFEGGMRLEDLNMIVLFGLSKEPKGARDDLPILMFKVPEAPYVRSFSPRGED